MTQPATKRNMLSLGRRALVQHLGSINVGNGYRTNAGYNVRQGWFGDVLDSGDVSFPLICIQKGKSLMPKPGPMGLIHSNGFLIIGAVNVGIDYEDALDDLEVDLLLALMPTEAQFHKWLPRGITGLTVGAPEQYPPGKGEASATVLIPVHLHTILER